MAKKKTSRKPKDPKTKNGRTKPEKTESSKDASKDVKVEYFRQNMRCDLSDEDMVERSSRIARQVSEKALRVEAVKSATAHLKAEIKQIDAEIARLAQELNDKACFKEVECRREFQYRLGKVVETRMDTGAQTYERALTGSERQPELPLPKTNGTKAAHDDDDPPESNGSDWYDDAPESVEQPEPESTEEHQDSASAE